MRGSVVGSKSRAGEKPSGRMLGKHQREKSIYLLLCCGPPTMLWPSNCFGRRFAVLRTKMVPLVLWRKSDDRDLTTSMDLLVPANTSGFTSFWSLRDIFGQRGSSSMRASTSWIIADRRDQRQPLSFASIQTLQVYSNNFQINYHVQSIQRALEYRDHCGRILVRLHFDGVSQQVLDE